MLNYGQPFCAEEILVAYMPLRGKGECPDGSHTFYLINQLYRAKVLSSDMQIKLVATDTAQSTAMEVLKPKLQRERGICTFSRLNIQMTWQATFNTEVPANQI